MTVIGAWEIYLHPVSTLYDYFEIFIFCIVGVLIVDVILKKWFGWSPIGILFTADEEE